MASEAQRDDRKSFTGARVRTTSLTQLLRHVEERGGLRERVLAAAGLEEGQIQPGQLIEFEKDAALWEAAAEEANCETIGLEFGAKFELLNRYGTFAYAITNAGTFGDALDHLIRFAPLHWLGLGLISEVRDDVAILRFEHPLAPERARQWTERLAAAVVRTMSQLTNGSWRAQEFHFPHAAPSDVTLHEEILGAPVLFDHVESAGHFDPNILDQPIGHVDNQLLPTVLTHLTERLGARGEGEAWLEQVRSLIARSLADDGATIEVVAKQMAMSVRTLQRRLSERGIVFSDLREDTQRRLALELVDATQIDLTEVAFTCGYADVSAFGHAFRRWTGISARERRRSRRSD